MENEMENEMMMDAVRDGDIETLELLLEQGSDPNFEDRWGTALMHASVKGRSDICELLLYWRRQSKKSFCHKDWRFCIWNSIQTSYFYN